MDRIDMDTDATTDAMSMMATAGESMATDWGAVTAELTGLAGRLGQGELGAAFLAGYQKPAADTETAVGQCCEKPGRLAELGNQCVTMYLSGDQSGHDHIASIQR